MSLTTTLLTASSGLNAAQASLRTISDNIANVNTPGYVRKAVIQESLVVDGGGAGVKIAGIKRITDQYLQLASLTASSDAARWGAVSQYLDNAQSLFGDPSADGFFFNRLDKIFAAFATAADDPSSTERLWAGDQPLQIGRTEQEVAALGSTSATSDRADAVLLRALVAQRGDIELVEGTDVLDGGVGALLRFDVRPPVPGRS